MEFIKNHFYKLTKEIPLKQLFQMPSWYNGAAYYYGNSNIYGNMAYTTYDGEGNMIISSVFPYETSKKFTVGRIYQASSSTSLYNDIGNICYLDDNESECFEEVKIGLNEISKKFMEKQINSGKMAFRFNFFNDNMVVLTITLNGKHFTRVSLVGVIGQVNEMLHNAYIALRKSYIINFKINLDANYRWSTIMGGGSRYSETFWGRMQDA